MFVPTWLLVVLVALALVGVGAADVAAGLLGFAAWATWRLARLAVSAVALGAVLAFCVYMALATPDAGGHWEGAAVFVGVALWVRVAFILHRIDKRRATQPRRLPSSPPSS